MFSVCFDPSHSERTVNQWDYVLSHWRPKSVYMIGSNEWGKHKPLRYAKVVSTAAKLPKAPKLVLLAPKAGRYYQGSVSLVDFKHPANCIYMVGSDDVHISEDVMGGREPDHIVYIDTETPHEMYSHVAAAITLYDRVAKSG